jgi:regulator of CtrA degradation
MGQAVTINPRIVEGLYCEALVLSDEVRHAFALSSRIDADRDAAPGDEEDRVRIAMSSEGLRTTTRMMHAVAWLLNHRAYFLGELSEFQLRRHGRLSPDMRRAEPEHLALLPPEMQALVEVTLRFYDRLLRLDRTWRQPEADEPRAIDRLRERLERRMVG